MKSIKIITSRHKILKEKKLILEIMSGEIDINDMRNERSLLFSDNSYNPSYDMLEDYRDAKLNCSVEELTEYFLYLGTEHHSMTEKKVAILTNETDYPVYMEWRKVLAKKVPLKFNIFCSLDESISWLDNGIDGEQVCDELEKLKNSSTNFVQPNAFIGF